MTNSKRLSNILHSKKIENNSPSSSGGTNLEAMDLMAMKDVPLMMSTSGAETGSLKLLGELIHLQNILFFIQIVQIPKI